MTYEVGPLRGQVMMINDSIGMENVSVRLLRNFGRSGHDFNARLKFLSKMTARFHISLKFEVQLGLWNLATDDSAVVTRLSVKVERRG